MSEPMLRFTLTKRMKPAVECGIGFSYVGNGACSEFKQFWCSMRSCTAILRTRVSDNTSVGDTLPEESVIEKYAGIHAAPPKDVLVEISEYARVSRTEFYFTNILQLVVILINGNC